MRSGFMPFTPPLPRTFYNRDARRVARELLGKVLVRQSPEGATLGRIVETEAYLAQGDPANHACSGPTKRNAVMFGPAGHAYVYRLHRVCCLNVVTEPEGVPSAVLIRAVEPLGGIELMRRRRGQKNPYLLTRGPGRLCQAFAVDPSLNGRDLTIGEEIWVADLPSEPFPSATSPRIGVTAARDLPLRFFIPNNPFVSRPSNAPGRKDRTFT